VTPWRRHLLIVVAAAAGFRILAWSQLSATPFFTTPVIDASSFDIWARTLLEGRVFSADAFFKPPLYPYLLSGLYGLFGSSIQAVQILQSMLGVVTAGVVLVIGRRVWSPTVGLTAGLITALWPVLPFFETQLLAETWTTLLTLIALERLLLRNKHAWTLPGWGRTAVAGLLFGVAALGRPNILLLIPAVALWASWERGRPRRWRTGLVIVAFAGLPILMPLLRNASLTGELVPISANLGANLVTGHHDGADGVSAIPVGLLWDDLQLECSLAGHSSTAASSRYLTGRAFDWMADHPGRTLELLGRKVLVLLSGWEARNNIGARWLAQEHGVVILSRWWPSTWLVLPFALIGLLLAVGGRGAALLATAVAVQAVSVLPFFVNARFRLPLLPLLALFAAAGIVALLERRGGGLRALAWPLMALMAFSMIVNVDWLGLGHPRWNAEDAFNEALIQLRGFEGRLVDDRAAEAAFRRAIDLDPTFPDAHERYGTLRLGRAANGLTRAQGLIRRGETAEARRLAKRVDAELSAAADLHRTALQLVPRAYRSAANLGAVGLLGGDLYGALAGSALADGDTATAREDLAVARQYYDQSQSSLGRALRFNPDFREASTNRQLLGQRLASLPNLPPGRP